MNKKLSSGIIRNKTEIFLLIKESKRKKLSRFSKQNIMGQKQLSYQLSSSVRKPLVPVNTIKSNDTTSTISSLPPEWIDTYEDCRTILNQIDQIRKQMMTYQTKRFTVVKESEQKQIQILIYQCAEKATKKIKKCQIMLDKIQKNSELQSESDHKTCKSVVYKLAIDLREKTKEIRAQQRAFVEQRKNLEQSTRASFLQMAAQKMLQGDQFDYIEEQELDLDMNSRNQEILKIVKSIYDLNDVYKELNAMVILQGSLLDRIDINIEESYQNVKKGVVHIDKAEKYQKKGSNCAFKTMLLFLVGIAILSIVLAIKWSKK